MDKLTEAASPYTKLTKEIESLRDEQEESNQCMIVLLDRLCTLKEQQQASDDDFRDSWRKSKFNTLVIFFAVNAALFYFDVIKLDGDFLSSMVSFLF